MALSRNPAFQPPSVPGEESEPPPVTIPLPTFAQPRRMPTDDSGTSPTTAPSSSSTPGPLVDADEVLPELDAPSVSVSSGRRTSSSAGEQADPKVVAGALAGLLGILATLVSALLLRSPRPQHLRAPTDQQRDDVAVPLARILARHVPAAKVGPDLMDGIAATAALGVYVTEGPLTYPAHYADIPADPEDDEL